jgi:hypothetical protein
MLSLFVVYSVCADGRVPVGVAGEGLVGNERVEYGSLLEVGGTGVERWVLVSGARATRGLVLGCQLFLGATAMKCSNSANCGESMFWYSLSHSSG